MSLEVEGLEVAYGGVPAVRGLSLSVAPGEIVGLIGPNGAGKSTSLHAIMGLVPARAGEIRLGEKSLRGRSPEAVARSGVARVPAGRRLFVFERRVGDLYTAFAQQWFPLLEAITLARRGIVKRRHYCEYIHKIYGIAQAVYRIRVYP